MIGRISSESITPYRELSPDEYGTFQQSNGNLIRFMQEQQTYHMVVWNHNEFEDTLDKISTEYNENQQSGWFLMERRSLHINRLLLNLLSMARTYLDHAETTLNRRYGESSPELNNFKTATSRAYDDSFAYRFLYKLRNYAQHCGMPVGRVLFQASSQSTGGEIGAVVKAMHVYFEREQLLSSYDGWGNQVKSDLAQQPDSIEVRPLVSEFVDRLNEINVTRISGELAMIQRSAQFIDALFQQLPLGPGNPAVIDTSEMTTDGGDVKIEWPALHVVELLKQAG